jgi:tRNA A-37 threonylcarbamoyl transferase component Bud32
VLRHLAGGAGSKPSILLPRVYHFAPTTCSLSMEYIPGLTLDERMRNAEDRKGFDDCLRASAAWLRGLHSMPPKHDNAGNDYKSILRQLELDCASLSGRNVMVAHVLTYMRSSLEEISSLPVKQVLLHGDFKASNLIWAPKGIYGIDISMRFKNPWVMDAAQFITNILLNWRNIPSMARSRNIVHVLDVFLEGYGHTNPSTRKVVVWWLLCFLLSRWQSDARDWRLSAFLTRPYSAVLTEVMALCDKNSLPGWNNEY